MTRTVPAPEWWLRLTMCGILVLVAVAGLRPSLSDWGFLAPAVFGTVVGSGVAGLGRYRGLLFGETLALSLGAFALVGIFLSGVPDPVGFADGLVNGWSDFLTSSPPADLTPRLRVVPYGVGWLGAAVSGELLRRDSVAVAGVVGPLVALSLTLLLSIEDRSIAIAQGTALAVGAVLLGVLADSGVFDEAAGSRRNVLPLSIAMFIVVVVAAALLGPRLPLAQDRDRFDLRHYQDRPWDPLDEPSPLVTLKASLKDGRQDIELFVIRSETPLERLSLATLGSYSGSVWTVADVDDSSASQFIPVDTHFPSGDQVQGEPVTFELEVRDSGAPWLPLSGWPEQIERVGDDRERLRFNRETGTVADPGGLAEGERFTIVAAESPTLSMAELSELTVVATSDDGTELGLVPPTLVNVAGDVFEASDRGIDHVVALSTAFTQTGFYDATDVARPGHSLARLSEFFTEDDTLIGFEEQFAAGAAVLLRIDGISARVVVGYVIPADRYIDGEAVIVGDDLSAWIEVDTEERGWVPVSVTPDRAREPEAETTGRSIQDVAIPNPPPPPAPPPEIQPPSQPESTDEELVEQDEETDDDSPILGDQQWVAVAAAGALIPLVVMGTIGLLIVGVKRRRRRKRAADGGPRQQIAGAWRELCDRLTEVGVEPHSTTTPTEIAAATLGALADDGHVDDDIGQPLHRLALAVDRAAFHPTDPDDVAVAGAWADYEKAATCLRGTRPLAARVLNVSDPRPLRRRRSRHHNTKGTQRVRP